MTPKNSPKRKKDSLELLEDELRWIIQRPSGRRAFLTSLPLLIAGCASQSKHRYREGKNVGQQAALTVKEERQMAADYRPKMEKEYPPLKNPEAQKYLRNLGHELVKKNKLAGNPYNYSFTVVDSENINAFALPAGTIYVTRPLIAMAGSEAELAGVVGHEIGHVKARHTAERLHRAKEEQKKSWLYGLGGALVGAAAGFGLSKVICEEQDKECIRRISMYGAAAGAGGGLLIQKFAFMAHSREDELEADRVGFRVSHQAGYHPDYVGKFYNRLLKLEQEYRQNKNPVLAPLADAMSIHPPSEQRVKQMKQMAAEASNGKGRVSSPDFEEIQKQMKS